MSPRERARLHRDARRIYALVSERLPDAFANRELRVTADDNGAAVLLAAERPRIWPTWHTPLEDSDRLYSLNEHGEPIVGCRIEGKTEVGRILPDGSIEWEQQPTPTTTAEEVYS